MGRPTDYCQEIVLTICDRLSDGESLRSICLDGAMPDKKSVLKWLALYPDFAVQYARAREAQADAFADELTEIADDGSRDYTEVDDGHGGKRTVVDHDHIARARLRVDTRKWIASKLKPKKYGERLELAGDATAPVAISIIDGKL